LSIAREGARSGPSVMTLLRGFKLSGMNDSSNQSAFTLAMLPPLFKQCFQAFAGFGV
jgi:hypothetical protein